MKILKLACNALLLALFAASAQSAGLLVIGDSISAQPDSWPEYIIDRHVMVMAQNKRTVKGFTLPADLKADGNIDTVVYYLGTNDMPGIASQSLSIFYDVMYGHLKFLKARGFRVVVVLPARYLLNEYESDVLRFLLLWGAASLGMEIADVEPIWDEGKTLDFVHPKAPLSREIAQVIGGVL